jgi:hypothetical protein
MSGGLPFLQILDTCYSPLGVCDHLSEEKGETGSAELCIAAAVQVSVVDCFAIGGYTETRGLWCLLCLWFV